MRLRRPSLPFGLPRSEKIETDVGSLLYPAGDAVMRPMIKESGTWEPDAVALFNTRVGSGDTVVDVGAHVGFNTVLFARLVGPDGHVIAVEPDPDNATLLRANIRRNRLRNVTVIEAAAWRATTRLRLRRDSVNTGDNRITPEAGDCEVAAIALDERLEDQQVAFIKIDAQGADHVALEGMRRTLTRCRPVVVAEFWPFAIRELGDDPVSVVADIQRLGYAVTWAVDLEGDTNSARPAEIVAAAEACPYGISWLLMESQPA